MATLVYGKSDQDRPNTQQDHQGSLGLVPSDQGVRYPNIHGMVHRTGISYLTRASRLQVRPLPQVLLDQYSGRQLGRNYPPNALVVLCTICHLIHFPEALLLPGGAAGKGTPHGDRDKRRRLRGAAHRLIRTAVRPYLCPRKVTPTYWTRLTTILWPQAKTSTLSLLVEHPPIDGHSTGSSFTT